MEGAIGARTIHDGSWSPHVARRAAPFSSGARGDASPRVPVAAGMDRAERARFRYGRGVVPKRDELGGDAFEEVNPRRIWRSKELRLLKTTHTEERFPDVGAVPPRACGRPGGPCGTSMDALGVATGAVPADELRQVTTTLWTSIEASINRVELPEVRRALGVTALEENERLMEEATALAEIIGDVRHRVDTAAHRRLNAQKSLYSNPTGALVEGELRLLIASAKKVVQPTRFRRRFSFGVRVVERRRKPTALAPRQPPGIAPGRQAARGRRERGLVGHRRRLRERSIHSAGGGERERRAGDDARRRG